MNHTPPLFIRENGKTSYGRRAAIYRCSCGVEFSADVAAVKYGNTTSCGCYRRLRIKEIRRTHGESKRTKEYESWAGMRARCLNKKGEKYKHYGGRGISICKRWSDYSNFLSDMGRCPVGFTLERKNVNGNYTPSNCIWASQKTQQNNRRNNSRITLKGETKTVAEWSFLTGIKYRKIWKRIRSGWSAEDALSIT